MSHNDNKRIPAVGRRVVECGLRVEWIQAWVADDNTKTKDPWECTGSQRMNNETVRVHRWRRRRCCECVPEPMIRRRIEQRDPWESTGQQQQEQVKKGFVRVYWIESKKRERPWVCTDNNNNGRQTRECVPGRVKRNEERSVSVCQTNRERAPCVCSEQQSNYWKRRSGTLRREGVPQLWKVFPWTSIEQKECTWECMWKSICDMIADVEWWFE